MIGFRNLPSNALPLTSPPAPAGPTCNRAVFNTFFGSVFAGAVVQQLGRALADGQIWELLGQAIPGASNFFANYIMVHALFTNVFRFVWPHDGTVLFVFLRAVGLARESGHALCGASCR